MGKFQTIPTIDLVGTGRNINRIRLEMGMSVKDIQTAFGFSTPQAVYKWIHGTSLPTIDNLVILSALFEVPVNDILVVNTAKQRKGGTDDTDEVWQAVC